MTQHDIDATKAPLVEHLTELRSRLMRIFAALIIAAIFCYIFRVEVFDLLARPLIAADPDAIIETLSPQEAFFTFINLSIWGGFFISFPFIATQLWGFVAPGLYQQEKGAFLPFLLATPFLFFAGASLAYFVVIPLALAWLIDVATVASQDGQLRLQNSNRFSEYVGFIKTLLIAFGISFQLPVLLTLMGKAGIVSSKGLAEWRKYAIVGIAFMAMILTPPDPISQIALGIPTYLLYEVSIHLVRAFEKKERQRRKDLGLDDDDEDEDL